MNVKSGNMYFLVCYMLLIWHQIDAIPAAPGVNVGNNQTLWEEIRDAMNYYKYRPIIFKENKDNEFPVNNEINDKLTRNTMNIINYSELTRKYKYQTMLQKYEAYAMKRGIQMLRDIPYYLSIELHVRMDTIPPMDIFVKNFTKKARSFFNKLYKQKFSTNIDKEFAMIDTVYAFNVLVYDEELTILNDLISKFNVNITDRMIITLKRFQNQVINNQRADMEYLCVKFVICRPTHRFTDNISNIARELLKLSDAKLNDIFFNLLLHIKEQSDFFEKILGKSAAAELYLKLEDSFCRDASGIREILIDFRSFLAGKHRFSKNPDDDINTRNKAIRILLDVIDQAFNVQGNELVAMHFDIVLKAIKDCSEGRNIEIEKILKAFVVQAVGYMKMNLINDAINELKVLVDVLMQKEDRRNKIYHDIFTHGSMFVRRSDIPLKMSLQF